jgi:hypothetical protein
MPSGKTILAAGAALVLLGGAGAGAWIASSDDEGGASPLEQSTTTETDDSVALNELPTVTSEQAPAAPEAEPEEQPQAPEAAPEQQQEDKPTRTQFPRERGKQRNDPPDREFKVPPAREFSGTGNATLGTVNVSTAAIVKWTTKGRFELRFGRESFPIIAPSPSGQLIVPPYRFEQVRVIARGRWTIRIVPQK